MPLSIIKSIYVENEKRPFLLFFNILLNIKNKLCLSVAIITVQLCSVGTYANDYSVRLEDADIREFVNSASRILNKTIIMDPKVKGTISIRSYEKMDEDKYQQFFLNVLDVYGFTVIEMPNNILKVVPAKRAKGSASLIITQDDILNGDELINKIVPLKYVSAKNIAPLLRQLNDNTDSGSIVHYEPNNSLLITGRAAVVNRLISIIDKFDRESDSIAEVLKLKYASAMDIARTVNELLRASTSSKKEMPQVVKLVADERTNSILINGDAGARKNTVSIIRKLDQEQTADGNTKVIYLKYAKAENLLDVLNGVSTSLKDDKKKSSPAFSPNRKIMIKADNQTNALIISAAPTVMYDLEQVISKLDIRRAQVLVEAIIVEAQDGEGMNLGIQWANSYGGGVSLLDSGRTASGAQDNMSAVVNGMSGLATGFYRGNWSGLFTALATNSSNDILATPSIVTLDNMDAEFSVGQEVPVLSSQQTTPTDKVYNTISRQSVGIILKVKPQINKGDTVLLEIRQEVSSVAENSSADKDNIGSTFNKRIVNNAVLVKSGDTVVVGGLLDKKITNVINKVPILGDIPIIGALFRQNKDRVEKRNLILFIKPTIIREADDYLYETSDKFRAFNEKNENSRSLLVNSEVKVNEYSNKGRLSTINNKKVINLISRDINAFYGGRGGGIVDNHN